MVGSYLVLQSPESMFVVSAGTHLLEDRVHSTGTGRTLWVTKSRDHRENKHEIAASANRKPGIKKIN